MDNLHLVGRVWADQPPSWTTHLPPERRVLLGPGNYWTDVYHHVGRDVYTDATTAEIRAAYLESIICTSGISEADAEWLVTEEFPFPGNP